MNSLSWFLYLAQVSDNLGRLFAILTFVSLAGIVIALLVAPFALDASADAKFWRGWRKALYILAPTALVAMFAVAALPSKQTMYLIAASEIGEKLAHTEAVSEISREAYDALRGYLKSITKEINQPDKK